jgi:hypothetical protein
MEADDRWCHDRLKELGYFKSRPFFALSMTHKQHVVVMDALQAHWDKIGGVNNSHGLEADLAAILHEWLKHEQSNRNAAKEKQRTERVAKRSRRRA